MTKKSSKTGSNVTNSGTDDNSIDVQSGASNLSVTAVEGADVTISVQDAAVVEGADGGASENVAAVRDDNASNSSAAVEPDPSTDLIERLAKLKSMRGKIEAHDAMLKSNDVEVKLLRDEWLAEKAKCSFCEQPHPEVPPKLDKIQCEGQDMKDTLQVMRALYDAEFAAFEVAIKLYVDDAHAKNGNKIRQYRKDAINEIVDLILKHASIFGYEGIHSICSAWFFHWENPDLRNTLDSFVRQNPSIAQMNAGLNNVREGNIQSLEHADNLLASVGEIKSAIQTRI